MSSTLLNIRYRNICYYPTSKVEPLAVYLHDQLDRWLNPMSFETSPAT